MGAPAYAIAIVIPGLRQKASRKLLQFFCQFADESWDGIVPASLGQIVAATRVIGSDFLEAIHELMELNLVGIDATEDYYKVNLEELNRRWKEAQYDVLKDLHSKMDSDSNGEIWGAA